MQNPDYLKDLIRANRLQECLAALKQENLPATTLLQVDAIAARYNQLKDNKIFGVLSYEQENITRNQIVADLLSLIKRESTFQTPPPKTNKQTYPNNQVANDNASTKNNHTSTSKNVQTPNTNSQNTNNANKTLQQSSNSNTPPPPPNNTPQQTSGNGTPPNPPQTKSKQTKHLFAWIGFLGSIASLVGLWFVFNPWTPQTTLPQPLDLDISLLNQNNNPPTIENGKLNINIGKSTIPGDIQSNGKVDIDDIPVLYKDSTFTIGLDARGYRLVNPKKQYTFTGNAITLIVEKDASLGTIKGRVSDKASQEFIEGAEVHINNDAKVYTNEDGIFEIVLPPHMRIKKEGDTYQLQIRKEGYDPYSEPFTPNSTDADIRLEKVNTIKQQ